MQCYWRTSWHWSVIYFGFCHFKYQKSIWSRAERPPRIDGHGGLRMNCSKNNNQLRSYSKEIHDQQSTSSNFNVYTSKTVVTQRTRFATVPITTWTARQTWLMILEKDLIKGSQINHQFLPLRRSGERSGRARNPPAGTWKSLSTCEINSKYGNHQLRGLRCKHRWNPLFATVRYCDGCGQTSPMYRLPSWWQFKSSRVLGHRQPQHLRTLPRTQQTCVRADGWRPRAAPWRPGLRKLQTRSLYLHVTQLAHPTFWNNEVMKLETIQFFHINIQTIQYINIAWCIFVIRCITCTLSLAKCVN